MNPHQWEVLAEGCRRTLLDAAAQFCTQYGLTFDPERLARDSSADIEQLAREILVYGADHFPEDH